MRSLRESPWETEIQLDLLPHTSREALASGHGQWVNNNPLQPACEGFIQACSRIVSVSRPHSTRYVFYLMPQIYFFHLKDTASPARLHLLFGKMLSPRTARKVCSGRSYRPSTTLKPRAFHSRQLMHDRVRVYHACVSLDLIPNAVHPALFPPRLLRVFISLHHFPNPFRPHLLLILMPIR